MEIGRKRLRSDERTIRQQKYLVTERLVNQNDAVLMEQIYKKTLNLMFAGAKNQSKIIDGNNHEKSLEENDVDKIEDKLPTSAINCKLCVNEISQQNSKICSNCNLKVCERCAADCCLYCELSLCETCVKIFGCCIEDDDGNLTAICEECKTLI